MKVLKAYPKYMESGDVRRRVHEKSKTSFLSIELYIMLKENSKIK